jgi:hypothetical protein
MGALGRPARSLPPWYQTNLVFAVSPVVTVRRNVACEMEAVQKRPVSRIILMACTGRSLAVLLRLSCPGEASRANFLLAGRSLAAIFGSRPVSSGLASFRPSERNDSVRAAVRGSEVERSESW